MSLTTMNGRHDKSRLGSGVFTERVILTPELASQLLLNNTGNRPVNRGYVEGLQRVLLRDEWVFNGEPIIVASTGRVLNGQHRLIAVVETGVSIDTNIVWGADESVFATIDTGKTRTVGNVLAVEKVPNYNNVAAALRMMYCFCTTNGNVYENGSASRGYTATLAKAMLARHPGIQESVTTAKRCTHYQSRALLAMLHYFFLRASQHTAGEMIEVLAEGGNDRDRPFNVLREHIIYNRVNRIPMGNRSLAAKTIRTFNAEVSGEEISRVQWRPDSKFPRIVGINYETLPWYIDGVDGVA